MNHFKRKAKYFKIYLMLFLLFLLITLMNTSTWNLCLSDAFSIKKNQWNQPKISNQGGRNNLKRKQIWKLFRLYMLIIFF